MVRYLFNCVTEISRSLISSYWSYGIRNLYWNLFQDLLETWQRSVLHVWINHYHGHWWHWIFLYIKINLLFFPLGHWFIPVPSYLSAKKNQIKQSFFGRSPAKIQRIPSRIIRLELLLFPFSLCSTCPEERRAWCIYCPAEQLE